MKHWIGFAVVIVLAVIAMFALSRTDTGPAAGPATGGPGSGPPTAGQDSWRQDVDASVDAGVAFLMGRQQENGAWMEHPAVTSLACTAIANSGELSEAEEDAVNRGLDYVKTFLQDDGSIWNAEIEQYPNYSTAVSLIAFVVVDRPQDQALLRAARGFILGSQFKDEAADGVFYGGIGYGKQLRPDLSNTQWALEALYLTDHLDREPATTDPAAAERSELAWERAREFLKQVQNLPEVNDQVWVASDPENRGGFVYMPGESKAGTVETEDGVDALRSYGSMGYAGLKSLIYARLDRDDPRVKAVVEWIRKNYTFDENPGMKDAGYYYYMHTAAKALAVFGADVFTAADGTQDDWRQSLSGALIKRQQEDGSWVNENGRWWESAPELVTSYAVLALEIAAGNEAVATAK